MQCTLENSYDIYATAIVDYSYLHAYIIYFYKIKKYMQKEKL